MRDGDVQVSGSPWFTSQGLTYRFAVLLVISQPPTLPSALSLASYISRCSGSCTLHTHYGLIRTPYAMTRNACPFNLCRLVALFPCLAVLMTDPDCLPAINRHSRTLTRFVL